MSFDCVLITGASSGIGAALAQACARPGTVLHLSGRDEGRLASVAEACRTRGATALPRVIDVRDGAAMAAWIEGAGRLDIVIANAGISSGADEDWLAAPAGFVRSAMTARNQFRMPGAARLTGLLPPRLAATLLATRQVSTNL